MTWPQRLSIALVVCLLVLGGGPFQLWQLDSFSRPVQAATDSPPPPTPSSSGPLAEQLPALGFGEPTFLWYFGLTGLVIGSLLVLLGVALAVSRAPRSRGILVALGGAGSAIGGINLLFLTTGREAGTLGRLVVVGALLLIIVSVLVVGPVTLVEHQRSSRR